MANLPFRVKAVYDYASPHDDDLSFPNGQIIAVTDEEDADWYYGEYQDSSGTKQQGLFPKNFVERYEPATPPRPSRPQRPKKEGEASSNIGGTPQVTEQEPEPVSQYISSPNPAPDVQNVDISSPRRVDDKVTAVTTPPSAPHVSNSEVSAKPSGVKAGPPVAEKPAVGSFRDRIAAFNKSTAAPVAPMKPVGLNQGGGSSFVKKPYVAPPPSRNAYVALPREPPPQKVYRREEDPEVTAQTSRDSEDRNVAPPAPSAMSTDETSGDQPKPTTLKERIALLQKQQMEQAARHTEAAQKKEKSKRPPKKRMESHPDAGVSSTYVDEETVEGFDLADHAQDQRTESTDDEPRLRTRSSTRRSKSKETSPLTTPTASREGFLSDPNDADQSGAGDTEDGGDVSTGRDDSDEKPRSRAPTLPYRTSAPLRQSDLQDEAQEDDKGSEEEDEEDEEEEEEMDPEVRRKMEIRERMAKMSGGMGMAGMFGLPGAMSPMSTKKQKPSGSSTKDKVTAEPSGSLDPTTSSNQPVMPLPGMQRMRSPEQDDRPIEVSKEEAMLHKSMIQGRDPEEVPEMEDMSEEPVQRPQKPDERSIPPPNPQDRPVPAPPPVSRGVAPPVPSERPVPPPPKSADSRPVPPPPAEPPMSPSPGSESDDEMSMHNKSLSLDTNVPSAAQSTSRDAPPSLPNRTSLVPPPRPQIPRSPPSHHDDFKAESMVNPTSPMIPGSASKSSRVPPIPGASPSTSSPPQNRAPPPPIPAGAPPSRRTTDEKSLLAVSKTQVEESEEVTEYDGDYDTDIASGAPHKDALKSHSREISLDEPLTKEEVAYHHEGLPSLGPPPGAPPNPAGSAPRAMPPPPPNQPPKHARKSSDMPRTAPPPPPPPKEQNLAEDNGDYDPYNYVSRQGTSASGGSMSHGITMTPRTAEDFDDMYDASPTKSHAASPPAQASKSFATSPVMPPPMPRQSLDVLRAPNTRRSMDAPRPSSEQGFIAAEVDLGRNSQWWIQRKMPPPTFQNRSDVNFEIEESSATQQGGAQSIVKHVYVLFMDYSQTVVTARFDAKDPSKVEFQQRHEPPPSRLRQDQLEDAHTKFGARIAEMSNTRVNSIVGDGTPFALVSDLMSHLSGALPSVGTRAYGALVYTNLANASVQQHDEIRAGDIVSFRNAKMQGHRGPVKQKYNIEVGKPDHVAVVFDWDGTKKKVRAWEQGRESKKVKIESYKLGDLKSGEVKVWRVMSREWVGWGGGHA